MIRAIADFILILFVIYNVNITDLYRQNEILKTVEETNRVENEEHNFENQEIQTIYEKTNEIRVQNKLQPLIWNDRLEEAANIRAKECDKKFSHTRPNGKDFYTVDYDLVYGENLSKGYDNGLDAYNAWMESSTHKDNILYKDFRTIGIGTYTSSDGIVYYVQEFGY